MKLINKIFILRFMKISYQYIELFELNIIQFKIKLNKLDSSGTTSPGTSDKAFKPTDRLKPKTVDLVSFYC